MYDLYKAHQEHQETVANIREKQVRYLQEGDVNQIEWGGSSQQTAFS
jgi:hypothetical protein